MGRLATQSKLDNILKKSVWKKRNSDVWSFICPLCRTHRRVPFNPKAGSAKQFAQVASASAFFSLITWPWFGWKGIVCFVPFWTTFEIVYRWRRRAALSCKKCGFDPYLYKIDVDLAKREIDSHWRKKFEKKGIPFPEKNLPGKTLKSPQKPPQKTAPISV